MKYRDFYKISRVNEDILSLRFPVPYGASVASFKNASAMLFVAAKVSHPSLLPQGQPKRERKALRIAAQMDQEGFGNCMNTLECEASCPKKISTDWIQKLNREYLRAAVVSSEE
ncbi:MAG: hypothetical protein IIA61_12320 [Candidatus Marinimicrobia bacterium]|nr:hypothetical protein [Candidatus Neomarinimicrobiota bacterium]